MGGGSSLKKKNIYRNHSVEDFAQLMENTETVALWHFYVLQGGID